MIGRKILMLFVTVMLVTTSCGKSNRNKNKNDDTAIRMGKELKVEKIEFYDAKPDISADAKHLTFVSGRESALRIFIYDRNNSKTPLSRLTDNDTLSSETEAAISPDGKWVIFVGSGSDGANLYARPFDKSKSVVQLTNDVGIESQISISSDSKLFAFAAREPSATGGKIYVGKIDASAGPTLASIIEVTDPAKDDETQPTWITADGGTSYSLVTVNRDLTGFSDEVRKRTITLGTTLSASGTTKLALMADARIVRDINFASTGTDLVYVANNGGSSPLSPTKPSGSSVFDGKVAITNRVSKLTLSSKSTSFLDSFGTTERSVSMSKVDKNIGLWVSRVPSACSDNLLTYNSALTLYDASAAVQTSLLLINVATGYASFLPKQSVCPSDQEINDKTETDGYVIFAKLNDNAVKENFTAVYVSVVTNDNEVYLYERVNGTDKIVQISNNISK